MRLFVQGRSLIGQEDCGEDGNNQWHNSYQYFKAVFNIRINLEGRLIMDL